MPETEIPETPTRGYRVSYCRSMHGHLIEYVHESEIVARVEELETDEKVGDIDVAPGPVPRADGTPPIDEMQ